MTMRRILLLATTAVTLGVAPGHAEENRLLPFWGQPFPSGYTWGEATRPAPHLGCRIPARRDRRADLSAGFGGPCPMVLHARG